MNNTLAEYGLILRSRWRWPLWGVIVALALATVALIVAPPVYRTEAKVFVRTPGDVSHVLDGGDSYAQGRARTYAALASSTSVSARVIAELGLTLKPETLSKHIEASNPPGTALIDIRVSAPTGEEAQRIATVLLTEYSATVHTLESVPGAVVPRAELIVVDPPGLPVRLVAWGLPISLFLLGVVLVGLALGATAGVLYEILDGRKPHREQKQHDRRPRRLFSQNSGTVAVQATGAESGRLPKTHPIEGDK